MATITEQEISEMRSVGPWGYGDSTRGSGQWMCRPEHYKAVKAAYEAMDEFDLRPDCDRDIIAAGGAFVRD